MSLSPWDLGNFSFDFSMYRPRRPSYVFATQVARRRNESYRHATKSDSCPGEPNMEDFIEGIVSTQGDDASASKHGSGTNKKHRKDSYKHATQTESGIELRVVEINHIGPTPEVDEPALDSETDRTPGQTPCTTPGNTPGNTPRHIPGKAISLSRHNTLDGLESAHHMFGDSLPGSRAGSRPGSRPGSRAVSRQASRDSTIDTRRSRWRYRKNLIVLSLSFILVFSAFRSVQNLQSSLNTRGRLGVIAMGCVHGTMFLTCLFAPVLINKLTSKWTIVLGLLFYLFWIAANFAPHFYTLIPTSIGVGFGQSLAWGAQITYIQKLAVDYAHLSKDLTHQELSKFNGIFLACFQTTHIWGNIVSSLMLSSAGALGPPSPPPPPQYPDAPFPGDYSQDMLEFTEGPDGKPIPIIPLPEEEPVPMFGLDENIGQNFDLPIPPMPLPENEPILDPSGETIPLQPGDPMLPGGNQLFPGQTGTIPPLPDPAAEGEPPVVIPTNLPREPKLIGPEGEPVPVDYGDPPVPGTPWVYCGVYDNCEEPVPYVWNISSSAVIPASNAVLKLMGSYLVFAFIGFVLILLCLEKIGAKSDPEKPCLQMVWNNVQQLVKHKTYRLLVPLLIFNGFEQGFAYADYNKSYISCTIGIEYVGYNMMVLGVTNSVFSILVGLAAKHVPREALIGIGGILHIGLLVFLLVWIPDPNLFPVFFVISALWGVCDAIWQTQCNSLVHLSCPDDHDVAFQNFRMLQGLGAAMAFALGAVVCVAVKLYIIITLMAISILFYIGAEYRIRRDLQGSSYNSS